MCVPAPRTRIAVICLAIAGCAPTPTEAPRPGLANPAAVYCAKLGGRLEIRAEPGGEAGYCHLPDGTTVEEWTLYRDNNPL
ncbi:MAG TPA: DUF333 domain-containing protein [Paracoccaceae bacterium]